MSVICMKQIYSKEIKDSLNHCLMETHFDFGKRYQGKVRDSYDMGEFLIIVTSDRQSAFDRMVAVIPYKGQVLNLCSAWWFEKTQSIVDNHLIAIPDPNVSIVKKGSVFPIEFVVRGYITGSTNTSLWSQYEKGCRDYCGHVFPDGLVKNQVLPEPILTPTTKEKTHDRPISAKQILSEGWMEESDWNKASELALKLFQYSSEIAAEHGLILVDTKYEFAKDSFDNIILVDELHTPDSSRYWLKASYQDRFFSGQDPEHVDKEFLRLWFSKHCDPYHDPVLPQAPEELISSLSSRYIQLFETITGTQFSFTNSGEEPSQRIKKNIQSWLEKHQGVIC